MPLLQQQQQQLEQEKEEVLAESQSCLMQEEFQSCVAQHLKYICEEEAPVKPSLLRKAFTAPPTLLSFFKPVIGSSTAIKLEGGSLKTPSPSLLPLSPYSHRGTSSRRSTCTQRGIAGFLKVHSPQPRSVVLLDDDSQEGVCVTNSVKEREGSSSKTSGCTFYEGERTPHCPSECTLESQDTCSAENDSSCSASAPVSRQQNQPCGPTVHHASQDATPASAGPEPAQESTMDSQVTPSGCGDAEGGRLSHRPGCKRETEWGGGGLCTRPSPTSESTSDGADECHRVRPSKRKSASGMSAHLSVWGMDCEYRVESRLVKLHLYLSTLVSLHGHDKIGEGCCLLCSVSRAGGVCAWGGGEGAGRVPVFKLNYMWDGKRVTTSLINV